MSSADRSEGGIGSTNGERRICYLDLYDLYMKIGDTRTSFPLEKYGAVLPLIDRQTYWGEAGRSSARRDESSTEDGAVPIPSSPEETLRRERQRMQYINPVPATQFSWAYHGNTLRILIPHRGNIYIQDNLSPSARLSQLYDSRVLFQLPGYRRKESRIHTTSDAGAIDPQLSPDASMVAFCVAGDLFVTSASPRTRRKHCQTKNCTCRTGTPLQLTFRTNDITNGVVLTEGVTHGLADFLAQEEMDRHRGFWWDPGSEGIVFARVDESSVPFYRITHQGKDQLTDDMSSCEYHRYPFAGEVNPKVTLGYIKVDKAAILQYEDSDCTCTLGEKAWEEYIRGQQNRQFKNWEENLIWFQPPPQASEYLARVSWLPDGSACAQWQNRAQSKLVLVQLDKNTGRNRILLTEESDVWINLHNMMCNLPYPVQHPVLHRKTGLPAGSFSFLFASERTGYRHLYLYTCVPGTECATLIRAVSGGKWVIDSIVGLDHARDIVYVTGTYDSALEKHLYALPLTGRTKTSDIMVDGGDQPTENGPLRNEDSSGVRRGFQQVMQALSGNANSNHLAEKQKPPDPVRLTEGQGMHSVVLDDDCRLFVDTYSDLGRPTTVKVHAINENSSARLLFVMYDASKTVRPQNPNERFSDPSYQLAPPELLSFPTSDGTEILHAALYRPNSQIFGPGPYPLICAVYGGPHVQRVNRSWAQCADMRAQRMRSLGFAVVKCDNRGSSRRGLAFESAIRRKLGKVEVLDQITAVRYLAMQRIIDPLRVGIYGWSYGGYLSAMCLCRAPDVFHVAVAGAPVTSWDGYDTHYTERYMGLPSENREGYRESAIFEHVPNMRGKLMVVHGLIDENVHFRHTARLVNRLIGAGKDYDLLMFPDERHSPRKLRSRIYMEQRIGDYFVKHLSAPQRENTSRLGYL